MTEISIPDAGTIIYWSPAKSTKHQDVADGFKRLGLENNIPSQRTPMACLKAAIADVFNIDEVADDPKQDKRVIDTQPNGFVVGLKRPKDKKRPGDRLGVTKISVTLTDAEKSEIDMDPYDSFKITELVDGMAGAKLWLPSGPCVTALREIVTVWGMAMDSHGGSYWLPGDMMYSWKAVEQIMFNASAKQDKDGNDVPAWDFVHMNCQRDADWVLGMTKKLISEMDYEVKVLEESLFNGQLGSRAIQNRESQGQHLLDKVANFENILGQNFSKLKDDIHSRIEAAAATAKLAALVRAEQEAQGVAA